ncbi:hypothetical protein RIF29_04274 [Crotalaria pallida]|uniref:Uncharacterized protein n=1 Tax=Crotalaria pallida TaxID=3830 RepID=A0AAN9J1V2_CROPI
MGLSESFYVTSLPLFTFHMRKGIYGMPAATMDAATMDAIEWWSTYGSQTPELAEVAKKSPYKEWEMHPDDTNMEESSTRIAEMRGSSSEVQHHQQKKFAKGSSSSRGKAKKT